ncbi:hypothetical protein [Brevundimonas sp.]|uniref:hypothetical protein n=1 Tax=Brevundimonas sp. TaxID=1871086 RepID=UPI0025EA0F81|nr:hypothetical protein [Brevundimonas sp.]
MTEHRSESIKTFERERDALVERIRGLEGNLTGPQAWAYREELDTLRSRLAHVETALSSAESARAQSEAVAAQIQLADAQIIAANIQAEATKVLAAAQHSTASAQRELADAQAKATAQRERNQAREADANFWFRRFTTSVTVANATALAGLLVAAANPDNAGRLNDDVGVAASLLFAGLAAAGFTPLALWVAASVEDTPRLRRLALAAAGSMSGIGAAVFIFAVMLVIGLIRGFAP